MKSWEATFSPTSRSINSLVNLVISPYHGYFENALDWLGARSTPIVAVDNTTATTGPFEKKRVSGEKKKRNRNLLDNNRMLINRFL
jgi:hypothetical protein